MLRLHQMKIDLDRVKTYLILITFMYYNESFLIVESSQKRMEALQDEVIKIQIKYQKELEKLERENKELRKQNLLLKGGRKPTNRQIKVKYYFPGFIFF